MTQEPLSVAFGAARLVSVDARWPEQSPDRPPETHRSEDGAGRRGGPEWDPQPDRRYSASVDAQLLGSIIVAVVGGAGLTGLAGGVLQFSRTARTSRLIDHFAKALKDMPSGAAEAALRVALERERLRLAAISIVRAAPLSLRRGSILSSVYPYVVSGTTTVTVVLAVAVKQYENDESMLRTPGLIWSAVALAVLFVVVVVAVFDYKLQARRAAFIRSVEDEPARSAAFARDALR